MRFLSMLPCDKPFCEQMLNNVIRSRYPAFFISGVLLWGLRSLFNALLSLGNPPFQININARRRRLSLTSSPSKCGS